jgi:hypothetical protein
MFSNTTGENSMIAPNELANEKNIETEYKAICANLNQLASFRFTLIGFYVAAMGLIAAANPGKDKFALMLWISLCFWILELRNRGLHTNMSDRGMQIEREYWGYKGERIYEPFISHWNQKTPVGDSEVSKPNKESVKFLFWKTRLPDFVSHSLGLDLLFLGVIVYSIVQLWVL